MNAGISVIFEGDAAASDQVAEAIILSSFGVGMGFHVNLIPHVLAPGIYGDVHLSFGSLLSGDYKDHHHDSTKRRSSFIQVGGRLYNRFKFGSLDIQPFAGFNLMTGGEYRLNLKTFGILLAVRSTGMEYSYQLPLKVPFRDTESAIHRIAFIFHV